MTGVWTGDAERRFTGVRQCGFTYLEMILVVLILAILAAVVMPGVAGNDSRKLDLAAKEVAEAIRFARAETMRTGTNHGISASSDTHLVRVYKQVGLLGLPSYTIYHPVDKKLYQFNVQTTTATNGVVIQSVVFNFQSIGSKSLLGFGTSGTPKYGQLGTDYMLNGPATITLSYGNETRVISVEPMTGRVSIS